MLDHHIFGHQWVVFATSALRHSGGCLLNLGAELGHLIFELFGADESVQSLLHLFYALMRPDVILPHQTQRLIAIVEYLLRLYIV